MGVAHHLEAVQEVSENICPSSPPLASCMLTSAQVEVADRSDGASSGAAVDVTPPPAPDMQTLVSSSSGSLRLAGPHAGDDADQTELILTTPFSTNNAQTHLQRAKEDANTTSFGFNKGV